MKKIVRIVYLNAILLGLNANAFSQSVTFGTPFGTAQTYTVPVGCTMIAVTAIGGQGGASGGAGGNGGMVTSNITVTPGQTFNVFVGGQGDAGVSGAGGTPSNGGLGGANGGAGGLHGGATGGGGVSFGGGGGGSSELQTTSGFFPANRVLVAGGGGGGARAAFPASGYNTGGNGGAPAMAGQGTYTVGIASADGGGAGTFAAGGAGGNCLSFPGSPGSSVTGNGGDGGGGSGTPGCGNGGGGGGGGYWGGGGGGGLQSASRPSGGGGGGMNYTGGAAGVTLSGATSGTATSGGDGSVVICAYPYAGAITAGTYSVCAGATIALNDATASGGLTSVTWSSGNPSIATVNSGTGIVTGVTAGSANIMYIVTNACGTATAVATVSVSTGSSGSITGPTNFCLGASVTLSDATTGGTWTSGNLPVATVDVNTGTVYSVSAGTASITYTTSGAGCPAVSTVTIGAPPGTISGVSTICFGVSSTLSNSITTGTWTSSNPGSVSINSTSGVITGGSTGQAVITYSTGCGTDATKTVTAVNLTGTITGPSSVCQGSIITLSDTYPTGTWSVDNNTIATVSGTGDVTGVSGGTVHVTYTLAACTVSVAVLVNSAPPITGSTGVCQGMTTQLSDAASGGTWTSSNNPVATISSTGLVYGTTAGTTNISYDNGVCIVGVVVTVSVSANAGVISGLDTVCPAHSIILSDAVTGGNWSSSNSSMASVTSSGGIVTGGTPSGVVTITYTVNNGCGIADTTLNVFVRPVSSSHCTTGINSSVGEANTALQVFPNPNSGTFTMNLSSDLNEEVHVTVTNIMGEKVSEYTTITNKQTDIKLNEAGGLYLLTASTSHGRYVVKVVVY